MSAARRQSGAAGALVVAILVFMMLGIVAGYLLTRVKSNTGDREQTLGRFTKAQAALDAFAATSGRLPCPADPTIDSGEESPSGGAAVCTFPEGTLPWKTIGMKRDESFDAWARKISYRVYAGANGLTRFGGASMVECDTLDPAPALAVGGLCAPNADVYQRATAPANFLAGKGLSLSDSGTAWTDVAYVLVSHGGSGLGGYTVSGARLALPTSTDERNNTRESGAFTIKAFSSSDTSATNAQHFDDLLAYRRIEEMVRAAGLAARDWPDTWALFTQQLVEGAINAPVTPGTGIGTQTLALPGLTVAVIDGDGTPSDLSFDIVGGVGGIGVMNGLSSHLESGQDEFLLLQFGKTSRQFAASLNHFGTYGSFFLEIVVFQYYLDDTLLRTGYGLGCNADGGLASFSQDVGVDFNRVVVAPFQSINIFGGTGISTFLVSEVKACGASETCATTLSTPGNTCASGFV